MVCCCCSVAQLSPTLCDPMDYSTPGLPVPHRLRVCPSSCPLYQRCHPAISSSHTPFSFCPQSSPVSSTFPVSQLMIKYQRTKSSDDQNTEVSASASVLPNIYYSRLISLKIDWFDLLALQGTLRSLLQHQFEGINSLVLCLCRPALTTICDLWEDYIDLCQQSKASAFQHYCLGLS